MGIRHRKVSGRAPSEDTTLVQAPDWDNEHVADGLLGVLLLLGVTPDSIPYIKSDGTGGLASITTPARAFLGSATADAMRASISAAAVDSQIFTGTPSAPTPPLGTNSNRLATMSALKAMRDDLVSAAPGVLDTLNELAAALGNDPNFATTIMGILYSTPRAVPTRSAMKALNTSAYKYVDLHEGVTGTSPGRSGRFIFLPGNFSAEISADTREAIYIKADAVASADGAWVRVIGDGIIQLDWYGVGKAGTTDEADAMVHAKTIMQATGMALSMKQGRYGMRGGAWEWAVPSGVGDRAGPNILTFGKVMIVAIGTVDAPIFRIHNDPTTGGGGGGNGYVSGGAIGPLWFEDTVSGTYANRHGFELYGCQYLDFGTIQSDGWKGDLVKLKEMGDSLTADRWHIYACRWDNIRGWNTDGWCFNNESVNQAWNGSRIASIFSLHGKKGALKGCGSGNYLDDLSVGHCLGWALDTTPNYGTVQRFTLGAAEIDSPQKGVRIRGVQNFDIGTCRISYRYNQTGLTPPNTMWPITAVQFGGTDVGDVSAYSTEKGSVKVVHFFRESVTSANISALGMMADFSNDTGMSNLLLLQSVLYTNPGFSVSDVKLRENLNPNVIGAAVYDNDRCLWDTRRRGIARARQNGAQSIPTAYGIIPFDGITINEFAAYDVAAYKYTCQKLGNYQIQSQVTLAGLAAGDRTRMRIMVQFGGTGTAYTVAESYGYASGAGAQSYSVSCLYPLSPSDKIWIEADQNSASAKSTSTGAGGYDAMNRFEVVPI